MSLCKYTTIFVSGIIIGTIISAIYEKYSHQKLIDLSDYDSEYEYD